jgi:PleD family two-component response regulator
MRPQAQYVRRAGVPRPPDGVSRRRSVADVPISLDETQLAVTISGGCAVDTTGDVDALMRHAGAALYRAKAGGRNRIAV